MLRPQSSLSRGEGAPFEFFGIRVAALSGEEDGQVAENKTLINSRVGYRGVGYSAGVVYRKRSFDKQLRFLVTGMAGVGGRITAITDHKIVFEYQFPRSATYRTEDNGKPIYVYGELDRVSGQPGAQQTRVYRSLADPRDYVRYDLACRPAKRIYAVVWLAGVTTEKTWRGERENSHQCASRRPLVSSPCYSPYRRHRRAASMW